MTRWSSAFGVALMLLYWTAHMDFPFVENTNNFLVDYHIVYAAVLGYLIAARAGHIWGLDTWAEKLPWVTRHPKLHPLFA